ncbi:MAG: hypothetical protein V1715_02780 [bacterium]
MSKKIDRVMEESSVLLTTTKKFAAELAGVGITAEKVTNFETQIETVRQKDTTFNDSKNQKLLRSNEQKEVIATTLKLIERIKNAAKIAFIDDKPTLKAYMLAISSKTPVSRIISDLSHLKESASSHKELLIQNGLKQADFDELDTIVAGMIDAENKQEDAKHTQKAHLVELNILAKEIEKTMFIIRKAAAIAFQGNPAVLDQFKPVTYKKSSTTTDTTTDTSTTESETNP